MNQSFGIIIPNYNHPHAIEKTVQQLQQYKLPCLLIDDGSNEETRKVLQQISRDNQWVNYHRHHENQGKGAAVMTGFRLAKKLGITHAIQVDADGQHDLSKIIEFMAIAGENPRALISGHPIYDDSVPMGRFIARYITHFRRFSS